MAFERALIGDWVSILFKLRKHVSGAMNSFFTPCTEGIFAIEEAQLKKNGESQHEIWRQRDPQRLTLPSGPLINLRCSKIYSHVRASFALHLFLTICWFWQIIRVLAVFFAEVCMPLRKSHRWQTIHRDGSSHHASLQSVRAGAEITSFGVTCSSCFRSIKGNHV